MDDGALLAPADALSYPHLQAAPTGEVTRVAAGIEWIRMPLPMELDHINLWLIETAAGYTLIDTGISSDVGREAWQALERTVLARRPLQQILLTHLHPDHAGLAAWLQQRHRVPVYASQQTQAQMRLLFAPVSAEQLAARLEFFRRHGLENPGEIELSVRGERYRAVVSGLPEVAHHPADGDELDWGNHTWRVLETPGHAAGHLCLHAPGARVLIAGDQVLPTISPNVSLTAWSTDPNPLASYLGSLERLMQLDANTLVLPSHGRPFVGLQRRIGQLRAHHDTQLERLITACREPLSAYETLRVLFRRTLRGFHQFLALGEAIAHLEYLAAAQRLARKVDADGIIRYGLPA
jgi:glyoxylase-like metal-dependent hydrolase (beta-lactamase superfamily II)